MSRSTDASQLTFDLFAAPPAPTFERPAEQPAPRRPVERSRDGLPRRRRRRRPSSAGGRESPRRRSGSRARCRPGRSRDGTRTWPRWPPPSRSPVAWRRRGTVPTANATSCGSGRAGAAFSRYSATDRAVQARGSRTDARHRSIQPPARTAIRRGRGRSPRRSTPTTRIRRSPPSCGSSRTGTGTGAGRCSKPAAGPGCSWRWRRPGAGHRASSSIRRPRRSRGLLHPTATVLTGSFSEVRLKDGAFALAIGNVPFADYVEYDPKYNAARPRCTTTSDQVGAAAGARCGRGADPYALHARRNLRQGAS